MAGIISGGAHYQVDLVAANRIFFIPLKVTKLHFW